jgi:hypothetical protein
MDTPVIDEQLFARILEAYQAQKLVPFLGAGMSFPRLHLWPGFVEELQKLSRSETANPDPAAQAEKAVTVLRSIHGARFPEVIQKALQRDVDGIPKQTEELAKISWPLTLTTNYDDLFLQASIAENMKRKDKESFLVYGKPRGTVKVQRWEYPIVLGRSPADCFRVLNSLRFPDQPIIWALQGFLGWQARPKNLHKPNNHDELRNQLVVGHREYRRVTHREPHFRRAFGEVFRERSFLFLGSGLTDKYLLDLFSEIVELYGPSPRPHFFVTGRDYATDWLRGSFGIHVVKLENYRELPNILEYIGKRVGQKKYQRKRFEFTVDTNGSGESTLSVEHGSLPDPSSNESGDWLVYSAGGRASKLRISSRGKAQMKRLKIKAIKYEEINEHLIKLHFQPETPFTILAAIARISIHDGADIGKDDTAYRDARIVSELFREILRCAEKDGACQHVRTMLLAAGPRAAFPRHIALQELIRGFRDWASERKVRNIKEVTISIEDDAVWSEVASGRCNILELLNCSDTRYWIELVDHDGWTQHSLRLDPGTTTLKSVLEAVGATNPGYLVSVYPPVRQGERCRSLREILEDGNLKINDEVTLSAFGVLPGSTLRIEPP